MTFDEMRRIRDHQVDQMKQDFFDPLYDYLDKVELYILHWLDGIESKDEHEEWQMYQFCRALGVFRSCKILISHGCAKDALALSRTMLEIFVVTSWVAVDPETRMSMIKEQILKQRVLMAKSMYKSKLPNLSLKVKKLAKKDPRTIEGIPSIQKMANDEKVNLGDFYATTFSICSAYLHNHGSEMAFTAIEQGERQANPNPFPSSENVENAWLTCYTIMQNYWTRFGELFQREIKFNWEITDQVYVKLYTWFLDKITHAEG